MADASNFYMQRDATRRASRYIDNCGFCHNVPTTPQREIIEIFQQPRNREPEQCRVY